MLLKQTVFEALHKECPTLKKRLNKSPVLGGQLNPSASFCLFIHFEIFYLGV